MCRLSYVYFLLAMDWIQMQARTLRIRGTVLTVRHKYHSISVWQALLLLFPLTGMAAIERRVQIVNICMTSNNIPFNTDDNEFVELPAVRFLVENC